MLLFLNIYIFHCDAQTRALCVDQRVSSRTSTSQLSLKTLLTQDSLHITTQTLYLKIKWFDYQIITTLQQYLDPSTSWCGTVPASKSP